MQLKNMQTKTELPEAPQLTEGMQFSKILGMETFTNKYNTIHVKAIVVGETTERLFRTSAKAIVDLLTTHFIKNGQTEAIENAKVVERRSKDGRNYLALEGF